MHGAGFNCEHCHSTISGVADHCPTCLWSKHTSGKKGKSCNGAMEPKSIELDEERCLILYRCTKCGHRHKQRSTVSDSFEALTRLSIAENASSDEETQESSSSTTPRIAGLFTVS